MGDSKVSVLGAYVAVSMVVFGGQAFAHGTHHHHSAGGSASGRSSHHHNGLSSRVSYHRGRNRVHTGVRYAYGAHVIQCVAFAKADAGIVISGNARDWWGRAEGIYERGSRPEEGSVLSFRANGRMPLGHVAVVSGIEDSRTIVIDQAHWMGRGITRDMEVKDVSQNNDWSAVRVQLGHGGAFGSIYPTHGFIYPRPDRGTLVANNTHAPAPILDPAPADLRPHTPHVVQTAMEVAEVPDRGKPLDLTLGGISFDAPNRGLR